MKIILWGTGGIFKKYKSYISFSNVEALVDNDKKKWGTQIEGITVISPMQLEEYIYDYIIIMAVKYQEIRAQLQHMGVNSNKIIDKEHQGIFQNIIIQKKYKILEIANKKGKVALISHTLDRTGAPLVLFNLAKVLIGAGYEVDVYSFGADCLVNDFLQLGISVTMYANDNLNEKYCIETFSHYDVIWVNTLVIYGVVNILKKIGKPVIWWLHEEEDYMQKCLNEGMCIEVYENLSIYGVGGRVKETFNKNYPYIKCGLLPYGIETVNEGEKIEHTKLVFAIIGSVCKRKGQDILIQAINEMENKWKDVAEFWIIGSITKNRKEEYEKCSLVKVLGEKSHSEVMELYKHIDVVVCPSLNDPLPVVVAEGMQQKKVCIVSDMTGMAIFISQYEDGLVCEADNPTSLKDCIQWVIDNTDKIENIGENAYKIYEKNFAMESFKNRIIDIIREVE